MLEDTNLLDGAHLLIQQVQYEVLSYRYTEWIAGLADVVQILFTCIKGYVLCFGMNK